MTAPRWTIACLRRLAPARDAETLIGDLEEAHRARVLRRGPVGAALLTSLETVDVAIMLLRRRVRLPRPRMSWLDFKLGVRMLVRYPVLTLVGSGSLALAIAIGAALFAFVSLMLWPRLPLPDGDRVVIVGVHDTAANQPESRVTADFLRWRGGTGTLTDFAAGRGMDRNLQMGDGTVDPVSVAEVTASMFPMCRVAPLLGRVLRDADARPDTAPVMVIGERLWRERFSADPLVIGRRYLVSGIPTTIVGVMPAAFRFPSVYEVWQPLGIDEGAAPRTGVGIQVWARLKPGVTYAQANAELSVLVAQAAAGWPATHAHLKAEVQPPTSLQVSEPRERTMLASAYLMIPLLVLLVSGNVALLMFARAATRESEIVVRTALGASRARLVAQFVAEALVLNTIAAIAGLALGQRALAWGVTSFTLAANGGKLLPFWITTTLPPVSIAYGIGLALLATAVTGILPALKMTRHVSSRLRAAGAGGGGLSFGGVWTALIVSQIAVTVAVPAIVFFIRGSGSDLASRQIGVPPAQYLTAKLQRAGDMSQARFEAAVRRVREDLAASPGVTRVALTDKLPLTWNGYYVIEVDEGGAAPPSDAQYRDGYTVSTAAVDPDYFSAFEAAPLAGRLLLPGDDTRPPRTVLVNQSFVNMVLGGRNAVGRHIRYVRANDDGQRPPLATEQPWMEIVGVVRDIGMAEPGDPRTAGVYFPLRLRAVDTVHIAAHVSGDMTAVTNTLRSIALTADPTLRIAEVQPLDGVQAPMLRMIDYLANLFGAAAISALVLALSGIYAVMSFAVSRRTREIGIRVALGSRPSGVVFAILRRPLIQVAAGIVLGGLLTCVIATPFRDVTIGLGMAVLGYAVVMLAVCLLACIVPARRALRVNPIDALRVE